MNEFFEAIENGDLDAIWRMRNDRDMDINFINAERNLSPLGVAIVNGNEEVTKLLLRFEGIDVNQEMPYLDRRTGQEFKITPLGIAVMVNKPGILRILLGERNIDPNKPILGQNATPLMVAIGQASSTECIIELSPMANPQHRDIWGRTVADYIHMTKFAKSKGYPNLFALENAQGSILSPEPLFNPMHAADQSQHRQVPHPARHRQVPHPAQHRQVPYPAQHGQVPHPAQHGQVPHPAHHGEVHPAQHRQVPYPAQHRQVSHPDQHRQVPHPAQHRQVPHPAQHRQAPHPAQHRQVPHPAQHGQAPQLAQPRQAPYPAQYRPTTRTELEPRNIPNIGIANPIIRIRRSDIDSWSRIIESLQEKCRLNDEVIAGLRDELARVKDEQQAQGFQLLNLLAANSARNSETSTTTSNTNNESSDEPQSGIIDTDTQSHYEQNNHPFFNRQNRISIASLLNDETPKPS
ncbi:ankyrin repeat domain-containing protein [Legionella drozanskii]|uniref:ankyrin repeat domain-containing protein n=1 Tax=Legionella drozanskii TaxID=96228 RepID=UPI0010410B62|nr:ankyrin repeat domain-containing protein [Legionella drozanskii]